MSKVRKLFTNSKIIVLLVSLFLALIVIRPVFWAEGVAIVGVVPKSAVHDAGIQRPERVSPMGLEVIKNINNKEIKNVDDFYSFLKSVKVNQTLQFKTSKGIYNVVSREDFVDVELNETEFKTVNESVRINKTINGSVVEVNDIVEKSIEVKKVERKFLGLEDLGLRVENAPKNNLRKGLDLQGGSRVILRPLEKVSVEEFSYILDNIKERLNVYGLSDVTVTDVSAPGSSDKLILIEMAGVSSELITNLIANQGKFEAKINNQTAFTGGKDQIKYVCRGRVQCSGLDPNRPCQISEKGYICGFFFQITLSVDAAENQANLTRNLGVVNKNGGKYLTEQIVFFLDGKEVDALDISEGLKGRASTDIIISGSGEGGTYRDAQENTLKNMKTLQTILQTGSLPTKLEIVKTDSISPLLGKEFIKNAWIMGLVALLMVSGIVFVFYRKVKIVVCLMLSTIFEIFLTLGIGALLGWNIDLAAIAGLIAAIGTGVNDVIVITDEALKKETQSYINWKEKMKSAFFIIMSVYFTMFVAMIPLWYFGAGLLKGFAIITLAGITMGILVTRPAYAAALKIFLEDDL